MAVLHKAGTPPMPKPEEHYRLVSLMNADAKYEQTQLRNAQRIMHHDKGSQPKCKTAPTRQTSKTKERRDLPELTEGICEDHSYHPI